MLNICPMQLSLTHQFDDIYFDWLQTSLLICRSSLVYVIDWGSRVICIIWYHAPSLPNHEFNHIFWGIIKTMITTSLKQVREIPCIWIYYSSYIITQPMCPYSTIIKSEAYKSLTIEKANERVQLLFHVHLFYR